MFYGAVVKGGKPTVCVPHSDGYALHLSQATLPASVRTGTRVSLVIKVGTDEPVTLCTLTAGTSDTILLDQFLTEYTEFSLQPPTGEVHVTG
jgi:hypothetical protein